MAPKRGSSFARFARRAAAFGAGLALALAAAAAEAQTAPSGVIAPGEAAVAGFSGALRPIAVAPGEDPDAETFIDLNGPSLRVVDLRRMGGPPEAQLVGASKPFTVRAASIGQAFGVALDDAQPPNLYAAATSAYGLPIVANGPDGRPRHVRVGERGAAFMPGLWGPGGGPGSIWKIDGATGAVSLFANVTTNGRVNSGPALGGLAYDPETKSLFVADRESGLIHRFGLDGVETAVYDHGVVGAAAIGLKPTPASAAAGLDVRDPAFDSARPEIWGYAAPERRVFGLAAHRRRLYYAVADGLAIWSVGLNADGSFAADATIEVAAPPAAGPSEIAEIAFDDQGRMYLAERPAATGAFDFEALSVPSIGRLLRYAVIGATSDGRRIWQPPPDEYAVGFPENFRNDNGGVAIGDGHTADGSLNLYSCDGFVWTSGEQLRNATDPRIAAELGQKDALAIDGLQGTPAWRVRRGDEPPRISYFVDYADAPPDFSARGHMGAIAIARACVGGAVPAPATPGAGHAAPATPAPSASPAPVPPTASPPPAPLRPPSSPGTPPNGRACQARVCGPTGEPVCARNQVWRDATKQCAPSCEQGEVLIAGRCCAVNVVAGGGCVNGGAPGGQCGVGQTPIGPNNQCCANDRVYVDPAGAQACCPNAVVGGQCASPPPSSACASGYVPASGGCCLASQATATGVCCPSGQAPSADKATCQTWTRIPKGGQCCASGYVPSGAGQCCASANLTSTGECCSQPVDPNDRRACPGKSAEERKGRCKPGEVESPAGACAPPPCPTGETRNVDGRCVSAAPQPCPPGESRDVDGRCVTAEPPPLAPNAPPIPAPAIPAKPAAPIESPPAPPAASALHCPPGMTPGPLGRRCWPAKAPPGASPTAPAPHCPPGTAPGPLGQRCWPVKARPAPPSTFAPVHRDGCPPVRGCGRRRP
jgi:hypothetical protein